jgi:hypothetical protein
MDKSINKTGYYIAIVNIKEMLHVGTDIIKIMDLIRSKHYSIEFAFRELPETSCINDIMTFTKGEVERYALKIEHNDIHLSAFFWRILAYIRENELEYYYNILKDITNNKLDIMNKENIANCLIAVKTTIV